MIKIVTDTASDITLEQARRMDISLLPLPVSFGEIAYHQLEDVNLTQFFDMLEQSKTFPVTSQTTPEQYMGVFADAKQNGDSVLVIPLSSKLSGSCQSAHIAKEMTNYEKIYIVDVRQACIGQRLLVEYAVRLRSEGKGIEEIAAEVLAASGRVRLYAALDTLKYLVKGGRISKGVGIVGSALQIKPVVSLKNGSVDMVGKTRGRNGAMNLMLQYIKENSHFDPSFPFYFGYARNREPLDAFAGMVRAEYDLPDTVTYPIGGVIGAHSGPDVIVAAWMTRK